MHSLLLILLSMCLLQNGIASNDIYCGERSCYDVLNIKSAYRSLSLQYHPDKNKSPSSIQIFLQVSAAHTVLMDENERKDYDHYLDHPEDRLFNQYRYYRHSYGPKTDLRYVVIGLYVVQMHRYRTIQSSLRQNSDLLKRAQELAQIQ